MTKTDLERGLSVWTRFARHLSSSMSYRVVTRVVDESRFKRTELRDAITTAVEAQRPRWRVEDPAELELWVLEYQRATFVAGLRLSDKRMRRHGGGRTNERRGALRPVVAAAMAGAFQDHMRLRILKDRSMTRVAHLVVSVMSRRPIRWIAPTARLRSAAMT
ncbi:MAG: hypothetical protein JO115_06500, partial [Pseudonocardiales bacterium]|nr:hypothetical protein [Pseudonocardiales bacterium]